MLADRRKLSSERFHPTADSDRCRHPQPNSRWSLRTLMEEWEEGLLALKGIETSTGRPTESTNLDPWDSQSLNHQPKNIHRPYLGLPAHMCSLVFMRVPSNRSGGGGGGLRAGGWASQKLLLVREACSSGLPCLASVEEEAPGLAET